MKCYYCKKYITTNDKYKLLTLDGDFIHEECVGEYLKEKNMILEMNDEEFENYMNDL